MSCANRAREGIENSDKHTASPSRRRKTLMTRPPRNDVAMEPRVAMDARRYVSERGSLKTEWERTAVDRSWRTGRRVRRKQTRKTNRRRHVRGGQHRHDIERALRNRGGALDGADRRVVVIAACRSVTEMRCRALGVMAGRCRDRGLMRVARSHALVQHHRETRERQHQRRRGRDPRASKHAQ